MFLDTEIIKKVQRQCGYSKKEDWKSVIELFEEDKDQLLFPITRFRETVLHLATYSKMETFRQLYDLARNASGFDELVPSMVNAYGNTLLHEAVIANNLEIVKLLVEKHEELLRIRNRLGETPLFRAASLDRKEIVRFLANKNYDGQKRGPSDIHRNRIMDGTPILHVALQGEHFDTALLLLKLDPELATMTDSEGITGLQILADMPSAFRSGSIYADFMKYPLQSFIYFCLPKEDHEEEYNTKVDKEQGDEEKGETKSPAQVKNTAIKRMHLSIITSSLPIIKAIKRMHLSICKFFFKDWPVIEAIWDAKIKHTRSLKIAKLLIKQDTSLEWQGESFMGTTKYGNQKKGKSKMEENQMLHLNAEIQAWINGKADCPDIERIWDEKDKQIWSVKVSKLQIKAYFSKEQRGENSVVRTKEKIQEEEGASTSIDEKKKHNESADSIERTKANVREEGAENQGQTKSGAGIPLMMATENGITEIVEATLEEHPDGIQYVSDDTGQNILHVAVRYKRKEIFQLMESTRIPFSRMKHVIDDNGYTLLHHAADMRKYLGVKPGPVLQLQEELEWFERVKNLVPSYYQEHKDEIKEKKPWELFCQTHDAQLTDAREWIKNTAQSCSTVAVLFAGVVFAAIYSTPGGVENGQPTLLRSPYFLIFTIADVIALACSLTSLVMFLSILTSPFQYEDFLKSLPRRLTFGLFMLFFSVVPTMLAFGSTIMLLIKYQKGVVTSLISVSAFLPVCMFVVLQFQLYWGLLGNVKAFVKEVLEALPWFLVPCRKRQKISTRKDML